MKCQDCGARLNPGERCFVCSLGGFVKASEFIAEHAGSGSADMVAAQLSGESSSWTPMNLGPILDGTWSPPEPSVGGRDAIPGLLYPGRIHTIAGESEAGKGWLMVALTLAELGRGNAVVYLDFEDEAGAVVGRMLAAGATAAQLRERFAYIRPEGPVGAAGGKDDLGQALGDLRPTTAILDGVTEAMGLHGLDPLKNADVATFGRMLPRWIAQRGPAVLASDHVTKSGEGRGRYAIGAVHKLNAVDGAAYLIENRRPFGIGMTGRSTILIAKDRPGALREHARPSGGGLYWLADLRLTSHDATSVEIELEAPASEPSKPFRPTALMGKVSAALERAGTPLTTNGILDRVTGKTQDIRKALACLVDEGWLEVQGGPNRSHLHRLVKPYTGESQVSPHESQDPLCVVSPESPPMGDSYTHTAPTTETDQVSPRPTGEDVRRTVTADYCKRCGMTSPRHTSSCKVAKEAT